MFGVGQTSGKSALEIATRIRLPRLKIQPVAWRSISSSMTSPGRAGSGSLNDPRRVVLRRPFVTRFETPSADTSKMTTTKIMLGVDVVT